MNQQQKYFKPYRKQARNQIINKNNSPPRRMRTQIEMGYSPNKQKNSQASNDYYRLHNYYNLNPNIVPKWELLYQKGEKAQRKKNELSQKDQFKVDSECTFQPEIYKNRRYMIPSNSTFLERNQVWHQNRIQKIVREKEEHVNKNLKDCTFTPEINKRKKNIPTTSPSRYNFDNNKIKTDYKNATVRLNTAKSRQNLKQIKIQEDNNIRKATIQLGKIREIIRTQLKRIQL